MQTGKDINKKSVVLQLFPTCHTLQITIILQLHKHQIPNANKFLADNEHLRRRQQIMSQLCHHPHYSHNKIKVISKFKWKKQVLLINLKPLTWKQKSCICICFHTHQWWMLVQKYGHKRSLSVDKNNWDKPVTRISYKQTFRRFITPEAA